MTTREAEKLEKLLDALRKTVPNKTCADCVGQGARGPQYVCVNTHSESGIGSFVCTPCSSAQYASRAPTRGSSQKSLIFAVSQSRAEHWSHQGGLGQRIHS